MIRTSIKFLLRVPAFAETDFATQYRACLEMSTWADRVGFDDVALAEHHGESAGFVSSPMTLAAAILGRTERISTTVLVVAPLHDPIRVAEQLATLACIAPGRVRAVVGAGYRREEFDMAGVDRTRRAALVEELIEVCHTAWTAKEFTWRGRNVVVTPPPPATGWPRLVMGGKSPAAGRRAARLGCDFAPSSSDGSVLDAYGDECRRLGHSGEIITFPTGFMMVSQHPDRTWERIARSALDEAHAYEVGQEAHVHADGVVFGARRWEDLRASGNWLVLTPSECIEHARRRGMLALHPLMGGIDPALAWESLRLVESEVLPALKEPT